MEYEIIHLPKEKWKGTVIPIRYITEKYYDVSVNKTSATITPTIQTRHLFSLKIGTGGLMLKANYYLAK